MHSRCHNLTQIGRRAVCGTMLLVGLTPLVRADVDPHLDPHLQEDTFAAEAAALLPPAPRSSFVAAGAPPNRGIVGEWSAVIPWTPHIPVSAANLPDGRILTFASNQRTTFPAGPEFTYAATWNPATGQFVEFNHPSHDMFCGALVMLPDGRVLVNGGRNTTVRSSIFDWRVNTWTRTPDMNDPRWYNTSVALPNGRVWTASGSGGSGTVERWDQSSGWSRLTGINWNTVTSEPGYITIWHPFLSVAPDGRLIHFGPTDTMHWVSPDGSGAMSNTGTTVPGTHYPKEGSWVMYDEGRILVAGGGVNTMNNPSDTTTGTSSTLAYTVDVRGGTPILTQRNPMAFARQFANCVVLPNGEVMVMGGNTSGLKFNDTGSIFTPEVWNPATGQWRSMADASVPRNYHSLALLLPDGRVMSGGGGLGGGDHQDAQLFTPPTLFNSDGSPATRPSLSTAPSMIGVGTTFSVAGTPGLQKFSFIKMSAITHSVNTDLRCLSLPFTETSPGTYAITAHSSLNVMTPGYWMLFGLNAAGVHSVAKIILVDAIGSVGVAIPGNQASYVGQSASLQMIGSGPTGSTLNWSATGLPTGLTINSASGLISGTPTALGAFTAHVTVTDNITSASADFTWTIQPVTFSQNFPTFASASGLTLNGNALVTSGVLRLTPNVANQAGSAFLSNSIAIGPDTSMSTRWVFRIHGTANGADGLTFVIQGNSASSLGTVGSGLGYSGIGQSLAIEIDNQQGTGDPNANHLGILTNGNVTAHLATFTPGWNLEDAASHTIWVEYDGPANQLRVYIAQGNVTQRPATAAMTVTVDLPALVGGQAWFGFTGATGSAFNNHDIQSWSLILNALALPAPPVLTPPGNQTTVVGEAVSHQMQATDPNGDLLTWSATGLPTGLAIDPVSGLISGTPTVAGVYFWTVTVTDSNTPPVSTNFTWTINNLLTVQPLAGAAVAAGSTVALTAQASDGLNPQYRWSFGDGTPDTSFSTSPSTSHQFTVPGRYLVTVTVRDDTGREVTGSYHQGVYAPATAAKPTASTSIAYERRTGLNSRLWVVNQDNDSVTVFDAVTRAKLAEVNVGQAPRSLALAPNGRVWVANADEATLTLIRSNNYTIAQTISLPRGSRPYGVVFDPAGANAYVALENGGKVLKLHPTTGAIIASLEVGPHVRHLSVTANGARLLATRFVTPRLPGEDTASVQTTVSGVDYGGEVLAINTATFTVEDTIILKHSEQPDTSNSAKGVPNYLGAAAISPDGLTAWVPSKQDNIKLGSLRNGGVLTHDMTVRSIASRIVLASQSEDLAGRIDFDDAGIASAAAFDPNGLFLFTALEGSREVAVADAWTKQEILRFEAGRAPQGLVLSPDGRTLFVHNFMDRAVTIHDLNALANGSETPPPAPILLNCITTEKLSTNVLRGKQFFYDTRDNRVAFQQYVSCSGCHNDGGQDGRVWDFTQFGEGLRNTITLRGHGGTAQGPLHWTGNFDEVQDFEGQIRNFALGTGLMSDADFHAGTRSQSLGDSKTGLSADLDALAAYVSSLTAHGDSPDRNTNGSLTAAALAGQTVFQQKNCAQCHSGTEFTDSALNVFHDVGTLKPASGQRLGAPLSGLDTPTLLGLYNTAPYLHDGSAATIEEAVSAHSGVSLTSTEMSNLAAFLRQLDDAGEPLPATITWNNPSAITYGTALSNTQLNATANVPGTFVYSPPEGTMLNAGNGQTLSVTFTPEDLIGYRPTTDTVTINVLRAPLSITAQNKSKIYGAALPALTLAYSGFVNGETPASLNTPPALSTAATAASPVGNYPITASGAADPNYTITHVNGTLAVSPAPLTITANSTNKVYGAALPTFTASYTGLANGDTPASLNTPPALTTAATAASAVGSYPITASGAADANYTITHVNGTLTVTAAPLTITANNTNKVYGAALPGFTANFTGLANGDTPASLNTPPALSTAATAGSPVGTYPIIASGAADPNYTITHVNGILGVSPALPIITWGNPSAIAPGTALSSAQLNATANVPGTFVYSPPSGTLLNAGNGQVLSVTFTPQDTNNFTNAVKNVLIDVVSPSETAFVVSKVLGTLRNDFNGWLGMQITVGANALTVTQLGRGFVAGNNGTHTVKLVRASDHVDVPNGSVTIDMAGGSAGQFKYAPLSGPVTLGAGMTYYLVSQEFNGGDYWHSIDTALTTTSAATCDTGVYFGSGYPWSVYGGANQTYVPVDFKYTTSGPTLSTVTITASDAIAAEPGSDTGEFTFTRSGSTNDPLTVYYTVSGTAMAGVDYASIGNAVIIPAGSSNATLTLTALDDMEGEGPETVMVSLAPDATYAIGSSDHAAVTVVDDEASPETAFVVNKILSTLRNDFSGFVGMRIVVGASPITVTALGRIFVAGNSGTHIVKLVNAANGTDVPGGSVSLSMSGGVPGQFKYANLSSPVVLAAGATYYVASEETVGGDYWHNYDTTLTTTSVAAELSTVYKMAVNYGSGGTPWTSYGTAGQTFGPVDFKYTTSGPTLSTVTITASDAIAAEPGSDTGEFTFTRSGSTNDPLTVYYTVSGTAMAGVDYASIGNAVIIPAGSSNATLTLTALDDMEGEGPETVMVSLAPDATYAIGSSDHAAVTVVDDEASPETAFVVNKILSTLRNDFSGFVGMRIVVGASPITVTALGRIFVAGNSGTHIVKLVNAANGTDVPGGSVSLSMSGGVPGQFKYANLSSPVVLAAGATYYVASEETVGGDYWHNYDTTLTTTSVAAELSTVYKMAVNYGSGGTPWTSYGTAGQTFGPVDFKYWGGF